MPPHDAELSRRDEWPTEAHWPVQEAIEWDCLHRGMQSEGRLLSCLTRYRCSQVQAVDGHNKPLSPICFLIGWYMNCRMRRRGGRRSDDVLSFSGQPAETLATKPSAPKPPPSTTVWRGPRGRGVLQAQGARAQGEQTRTGHEAMRCDIAEGRHTTASLDAMSEKTCH
jgi:hypothetical protein